MGLSPANPNEVEDLDPHKCQHFEQLEFFEENYEADKEESLEEEDGSVEGRRLLLRLDTLVKCSKASNHSSLRKSLPIFNQEREDCDWEDEHKEAENTVDHRNL